MTARRDTRTRDTRRRTRDTRARDTRRRIGRFLLVVLAAVCLLAPPTLIAHPIAWIPLLACLLMLAVSVLYLQIARRGLSVSVEEMVSTCERGRAAELSLRLANRSFVPLARVELEFFVTDIDGELDDVRVLSASVRARADLDLAFDVQFPHVGTYGAGVRRVAVHDLLGLFSANVGAGTRREVTVSPRDMTLGPAATLEAAPDETNRAVKPIAADDVDFANVREYRLGDQMKTVHWNLTARSATHTMYTKLFETYVNPSLTVCIDPIAEDGRDREELMSFMDGMVEVALAVCRHAREEGVDAEVRYVDRDGQAALCRLSSIADATSLVAQMRRITPSRDAADFREVPADMLREAALMSHGAGNVVLVTSRLDAGEIATMCEASLRRRNATVFLASPTSLVGRERADRAADLQALSAAGGSWWLVESNPYATEVRGL